MSVTNRPNFSAIRKHRSQNGATVVEFGLILSVFLMAVFAVIEMARLLFLFNTLQDVTRRAASAAANTTFNNAAELDKIRQQAIFRDSAGGLVLMKELTDQAIRIEYMSVRRESDGKMSMEKISPGSLPTSPAANRSICLGDPYSPSCIRFVRVRVCDPENTTTCNPMRFNTMTTLIIFSIPLTKATTLSKVQSLGNP